MKHFSIKFNHGVEIGARLAYLGHYHRTKDPHIMFIADQELEHQKELKVLLGHYKENPSKIINLLAMSDQPEVYVKLRGQIYGSICSTPILNTFS